MAGGLTVEEMRAISARNDGMVPGVPADLHQWAEIIAEISGDDGKPERLLYRCRECDVRFSAQIVYAEPDDDDPDTMPEYRVEGIAPACLTCGNFGNEPGDPVV